MKALRGVISLTIAFILSASCATRPSPPDDFPWARLIEICESKDAIAGTARVNGQEVRCNEPPREVDPEGKVNVCKGTGTKCTVWGLCCAKCDDPRCWRKSL